VADHRLGQHYTKSYCTLENMAFFSMQQKLLLWLKCLRSFCPSALAFFSLILFLILEKVTWSNLCLPCQATNWKHERKKFLSSLSPLSLSVSPFSWSPSLKRAFPFSGSLDFSLFTFLSSQQHSLALSPPRDPLTLYTFYSFSLFYFPFVTSSYVFPTSLLFRRQLSLPPIFSLLDAHWMERFSQLVCKYLLLWSQLRSDVQLGKKKKERAGKGRGKTFDLTTITNRCKREVSFKPHFKTFQMKTFEKWN